jgi:hypothetical protein
MGKLCRSDARKIGKLLEGRFCFTGRLRRCRWRLAVLSRPEMEPFIGDISPCFVGEDKSSSFISTSAFFLKSIFSS